MDIKESERPLYYIDSHFSPELGQDFSDWNNVSDFLPDMSEWVWDQLDYYVRRNIKIRRVGKNKEIQILSALKTARKYDKTCRNNNTVHTVVTHLYVCELLLQVLSMIGGNEWSYAHGYKFHPPKKIKNIFYLPIKIQPGLSGEIHKLFFASNLHAQKSLKLKDYLIFCPELRKFFFENQKIIPKVTPCSEGYSCTGAHSKDGKYHVVTMNTMDYHTLNDSINPQKAQKLHKKNFPEQLQYNIDNKFANFSVEDENLADKFYSITRDPEGKTFSLGFGGGRVQKQRDIEIRFAIIFTLGSLGRYRPWIWDRIEDEDPEKYFAVKRFLEHNQTLFPYLILGYLSGKYFTFDKKTIWQ